MGRLVQCVDEAVRGAYCATWAQAFTRYEEETIVGEEDGAGHVGGAESEGLADRARCAADDRRYSIRFRLPDRQRSPNSLIATSWSRPADNGKLTRGLHLLGSQPALEAPVDVAGCARAPLIMELYETPDG